MADLLLHAPVRYTAWPPRAPAVEDLAGRDVTFLGRVLGRRRTRMRRGGSFLDLQLDSDGAQRRVRFYNQAWLFERLLPGARLLVGGRVSRDGRGILAASRHAVLEDGEDPAARLQEILPWPRSVSGVPAGTLRALVESALERVEALPDPLPEAIRERLELRDLHAALRDVHRPARPGDAQQGARRLMFDRFCALFLPLARDRRRTERAPEIAQDDATRAQVADAFPFAFTPGQQRALQDILADLGRARPMRRLLQGDVGSGKTAVAAAAGLAVARVGHQVLMVAPTDVLARQHAETLEPVLRRCGIRGGLLSAGLPGAERRAVLEGLATGRIQVLAATHAALAPAVKYRSLGLVVIDEQHRFGVRQRLAARGKGHVPHMLAMSATPIPRSLRLALLGDLDHSLLHGLPAGRSPVTTCVSRAADAWGDVKAAVAAGERAFVVFPSIAGEELPALEREGVALVGGRGPLAGVPHVLLHGRTPPAERVQAFEAFRRGERPVLLATSLVEVGVDVPEATVMVVVGAERFGLATLHQLRGRIGRGPGGGRCHLLPGADASGDARERLAVLERERDGFRIAEDDLARRGPGELVGVRQAGAGGPWALDREEDQRLFEAAHAAAQELVAGGTWLPGDGGWHDVLVTRSRGLGARPADAV